MKIRKRAKKSLGRGRTQTRIDPESGHPLTLNRQGIILKTPEQIAGIRAASQLTRAVLDRVAEFIGEGVTTKAIDDLVHEMITEAGAIPATLGYGAAPDRPAFPASACTSVNEVVCHGIPSPDRVLRSGDIVNVDVTSILEGYFGDASRMFFIGDVDEEARRLVDVARECMERGIDVTAPGVDFGAIAAAIEDHAKANGYTVVHEFGGHGVGLRFHEPPHVAHQGPARRGILMEPGMVFTVEPMINAGDPRTRILSDGWTAVTIDGALSAQWEHTVVVTETGVERLTA